MKIYCLRQKKYTETKNEHMVRSKNNKMRLVGECIECGANMSKFIKATNKQGRYICNALAYAGFKALGKMAKVGAKQAVQSHKAK